MAYHMAMPWHSGEQKIQSIIGGPDMDNPTVPMLSQQAVRMLQTAPLVAVGTVDAEGRPWTTIWGGASGLSQPLGNSIVGIKTFVDRRYDPVVDVLFGSNEDGQVIREEGTGRMVSALAIDLETRKRVKLCGRMIAGAVATKEDEHQADDAVEDEPEAGDEAQEDASQHSHQSHQVQLVCRIDQSLGNCPKYLNKKHVMPSKVDSSLLSESADLSREAVQHIMRSDLFFISSSHGMSDMDTNHRGGPPGFVRSKRSDTTGLWTLFWPEYSGNRLYQTLGNLAETPLAGLVFPDFTNGDVLYVTGHTETLIGASAAKILPRSNLAVALTVSAARYVRQGLPFRGSPGELSPYNPKLRRLATEAASAPIAGDGIAVTNTAALLSTTTITPTINRYTFMLSNPTTWTAGQWVALDFSDELDLGYSHMRDDDPESLNDDFVRTFTVSSAPQPSGGDAHTFDVTARTVGTATRMLSRQRRGGLEVPVRGFGGDVCIQQEEGRVTGVVAGGVGITPVMAQLEALDLKRLRVFWTLGVQDVALAVDVVERVPADDRGCVELFLTGAADTFGKETQEAIGKLEGMGTKFHMKRLARDDIEQPGLSNRWYVCVSPRLRKSISEWLEGKEMIFEDFNF